MSSYESKDIPPLASDADLLRSHDVFAEIIAENAPTSIVYGDEQVIAIMDIQPINQGHVLVIPIQPARFLSELDEQTAAHLFVLAQKIALAIRESGLPCGGINMLLADGATAGQEVPHLHLYVFPRVDGDGFGFTFPERYFGDLPARSELEKAADRIRSAL